MPVLVTAGLVSELRPSASAGWMVVRERERELSSALQPAVSRLVLQGAESKQRFEAEWPAQLARASVAPVFGRQAVVVAGPVIRREAARHSP